MRVCAWLIVFASCLQRDGVQFVYKNKGRAIIADEMVTNIHIFFEISDHHGTKRYIVC